MQKGFVCAMQTGMQELQQRHEICNKLQANLMACTSVLTIRRMGVCEWDARLYWTAVAAACKLQHAASAPHGLHINGPPDILAIAEHKRVLCGPIINHVRIYLACGTVKTQDDQSRITT